MLAAMVFAAICLQHASDSTCLAEEILSKVGDQLLEHVVSDTRDLEQAAFLTQDRTGALQCRLWPLTTERAAATYHGTLPPDTIAIIHTHPREWLSPSQHDGLLSLRLHLPV